MAIDHFPLSYMLCAIIAFDCIENSLRIAPTPTQSHIHKVKPNCETEILFGVNYAPTRSQRPRPPTARTVGVNN